MVLMPQDQPCSSRWTNFQQNPDPGWEAYLHLFNLLIRQIHAFHPLFPGGFVLFDNPLTQSLFLKGIRKGFLYIH